MNQDWNDPKSQLQQCCLVLRDPNDCILFMILIFQEFIMNQDWNDPKSQLQQCCLVLRDPNDCILVHDIDISGVYHETRLE